MFGMLLVFCVKSYNAVLFAYPHVGCYGGWKVRRYLNLDLGFWRGDRAVIQCYTAASQEGYKIFAINEGKCLSGQGAENHYQGFDKSNGCSAAGTGGRNAYDIYLIAGPDKCCKNLADGEYQDSRFCHRFVTCIKGQASAQICPGGLPFDPSKRECRDTTQCFNVAPCKNAVDGEYRHPTSCRKYLVCRNGVPFEMFCPSNLWFNDATKLCEDQGKVNCQHDPCMEFPCMNGGICNTSPAEQNGYTCSCPGGFTGFHCEKEE